MSSTLQELRAAAESYKSFPVAVAAVVQAMFDKGATRVVVGFDPRIIVDAIDEVEGKVDRFVPSHHDLTISGVGLKFAGWFNIVEERFSTKIMNESGSRWMVAYIHHARVAMTCGRDYTMQDLSTGDSVNPKQDRSARRLVRELPKLLSPSEAYRTVVIDESGTQHTLAKSLPSTTINGLRISWPEKMIGFGREGLTLKFGAVLVSMRSFIQRLILDPAERKQLMLLSHPWLQGIVEVEVADPQVADIPIPPKPGDNLSNFIIPSGHAQQLAKAILQILPDVVLREMNKLVVSYIHDFVEDDGLFLSGHTYKIVCADPLEVQHSEGQLLWKRPGSTSDTTQLLLDATNPVFRTVSTYDHEVMQIIWWQLATWIEFNHRAIIDNPVLLQDSITKTYLALREQNPERWDD